MMTAPEIVALMRERQSSYALQDNVGAAHTARVLADLIILAELPPRPSDAAVSDLKRKFLGQARRK